MAPASSSLWGINVIYHISRPHDALLDDVDASGGTVYRGIADKEPALTEPGLIVYRFDAPLVFANAIYPYVRAAVAAYRVRVTAADFAQAEPAPAPSPI